MQTWIYCCSRSRRSHVLSCERVMDLTRSHWKLRYINLPKGREEEGEGGTLTKIVHYAGGFSRWIHYCEILTKRSLLEIFEVLVTHTLERMHPYTYATRPRLCSVAIANIMYVYLEVCSQLPVDRRWSIIRSSGVFCAPCSLGWECWNSGSTTPHQTHPWFRLS